MFKSVSQTPTKLANIGISKHFYALLSSEDYTMT